jgi:hypothetical protein
MIGPVVAATIMTVGLVLASPVSADCVAPAITYDGGPVTRGSTIRVVGTAWGDNCYDTGPPPEGEGVLGRPLDDIELFVVQGGTETLVATGAARTDYGFVAEIVVPARLAPGPATISARSASTPANEVTIPLTITSAEPAARRDRVTRFGPRSPSTTAPTAGSPSPTAPTVTSTEADGSSGGSSGAWWVVAVVAAVGAAGVGLYFVVRRRG